MKKKSVFRLFCLALSVLALFTFSCAGKNAVAGTWTLREYVEELGGSVTLQYTFTENGLVYVENSGEDPWRVLLGTYREDGDTVYLESEEEEKTQFSVSFPSEDRMIFSAQGQEDKIFQRVS